MHIKDQELINDDVQLDGNQFTKCIFRRCRMHFRAKAPVALNECVLDNVSWHFSESAALTLDFMRAMTELVDNEDFGRLLLINTFPKLKEWVKPEILESFEKASSVESGKHE